MGAYLFWTPKVGPAKFLSFDVVVDEGSEFNSIATEYPVEDGVNVSDHVRREVVRVSLEVFVSNSPIEDVNERGSAVRSVPVKFEKYKAPLAPTPGAVFNAIGGAVSSLFGGQQEYAANVLQFSREFDFVADTLAALEKIRDTVQLVDVVTSKRYHENMLLEKVSMQRSAATGDGARFKLELRELRRVQVALVASPIPTEARGQVAKNKGAKPAKEIPAGPQKSILKSGLNRILGR